MQEFALTVNMIMRNENEKTAYKSYDYYFSEIKKISNKIQRKTPRKIEMALFAYGKSETEK